MTKPRKVMTRLTIEEISGVDKAAQVPAEALIMKRYNEDEETRKFIDDFTAPRMTTAQDGHTHLLDDVSQGGETTWNRAEGAESGHVHPWVRNLDGDIVIGEAEGHTHQLVTDPDITAASKSAQGDKTKESKMDPKDKEALEALTKRAERAESILKLDADSRAHFDGLTETDQETFLAKSAADQTTDVAKSLEDDKVIFKAANGDVFRASDDPRLVKMAKERDADRVRMDEAVAKADMLVLTKRADEEMSNVPGTVEVRANILKALGGVAGAEEFIKAANTALEGAFVAAGVAGAGAILKAADKLEVLANAYATANSVTIEQGHAAVLETPEGSALYAELSV
jgi:hypothetical protein